MSAENGEAEDGKDEKQRGSGYASGLERELHVFLFDLGCRFTGASALRCVKSLLRSLFLLFERLGRHGSRGGGGEFLAELIYSLCSVFRQNLESVYESVDDIGGDDLGKFGRYHHAVGLHTLDGINRGSAYHGLEQDGRESVDVGPGT